MSFGRSRFSWQAAGRRRRQDDPLLRLAEMDVDSEEAGRKRETHHGSEMAGGSRRTSKKISETTEWPSVIELMDASAKVSREKYMKRLVAKRNAENPDAAPLVLEELTEQQRTSLKEDDLAREFVLAEAYVASRMEEYSRVEELDPNQDNDDRVYQEDRERWGRKWAKEFGSFEDKSMHEFPSIHGFLLLYCQSVDADPTMPRLIEFKKLIILLVSHLIYMPRLIELKVMVPI